MRFGEGQLVSPDQSVKSSSVYVGFLILTIFKNQQRATIFEIYEQLYRKNKALSYGTTMYALMFLFTSGIIEFSAPYVYRVK